jgi:hypothetical protein
MDAMQALVVGVLRGVLNSSLKGTTPTQLKEAIRDGTSLWGAAEGNIKRNAASIPPFVISIGGKYIDDIEKMPGGFTGLVLEWLKTDQPVYYRIISDAPNGRGWLDKQTKEILHGIGILK